MSDPARLSFHVPAPAVRPGGTPDFSDVKIPPAGEVRRPEVDVAPEDIRDLAYSIIRVLNRDGEAVGPWAGMLSNEELLEGLRHMMTCAPSTPACRWPSARARPRSTCSTWARRR